MDGKCVGVNEGELVKLKRTVGCVDGINVGFIDIEGVTVGLFDVMSIGFIVGIKTGIIDGKMLSRSGDIDGKSVIYVVGFEVGFLDCVVGLIVSVRVGENEGEMLVGVWLGIIVG